MEKIDGDAFAPDPIVFGVVLILGGIALWWAAPDGSRQPPAWRMVLGRELPPSHPRAEAERRRGQGRLRALSVLMLVAGVLAILKGSH